MYQVVEQGTGRAARINGIKIGGKTGSANKIDKNGYNQNKMLSSFVAFFPVDDPKYLIYLFLDEPKLKIDSKKNLTGGASAAPTVRKIIEKSLSIIKIYPEKT